MSKSLDATSFRTSLEAVVWSDPSSTNRLVSDTYGGGLRAASDPIYLGTDNQIRYYLDTKLPVLSTERDLPDDTAAHPCVLEIRNFDGSTPPFQFGFPVGSLGYVAQETADTSKGALELHSTPFRVYLDVLGRSLWLVLDSHYQDELGEDIDIPLRANPWDYMPSVQNGRNIFKAFMIQRVQDLGTTDDRHSFFEALFKNKSSTVDIRVFVASAASVEAALQRGSAARG